MVSTTRSQRSAAIDSWKWVAAFCVAAGGLAVLIGPEDKMVCDASNKGTIVFRETGKNPKVMAHTYEGNLIPQKGHPNVYESKVIVDSTIGNPQPYGTFVIKKDSDGGIEECAVIFYNKDGPKRITVAREILNPSLTPMLSPAIK